MRIAAKITALGLTMAMMMSLASCSLLGGSKLAPNKVMKFAEEDGAEIFEDAGKFKKVPYDELDEGICIDLTGKDVKKVMGMENLCVIPVLSDFYRKEMTEAAVYIKLDKDDSGYVDAKYVFSLVFEDEDSAEDYFDDVDDGIQPNAGTPAENDDGEEDGIAYSVMNITDGSRKAAVGVYRDGNTVLFIIGYGYDNKSLIKDVDKICDAFGVHQVSDT